MKSKAQSHVSDSEEFIKIDSFNKKTKKIIQEHCIIATRIDNLWKLKDFLINQIHMRKCLLSDNNFIPATAAMDTIYNHLMLVHRDVISSSNEVTSIESELGKLFCDQTGSLDIDIIYYQPRKVPPIYRTSEYDNYFEWQLSCELGITYEDTKIFIAYRDLIVDLFKDAFNKLNTDKPPRSEQIISKCLKEKEKLENILHQKDLDAILLRTSPNDVHIAESKTLFVRIFNVLKKYDLKDPGDIDKNSQQIAAVTVESEGIYIIREREFMTQDKLVYKLGRSNNMINRARQYPKGSEIILLLKCSDTVNVETKLIKLFSKDFKQCKEYGTEYFEGDINSMIKLAVNTILSHNYQPVKIKAPRKIIITPPTVTLHSKDLVEKKIIIPPTITLPSKDLVENKEPSGFKNPISMYDIVVKYNGRVLDRENLLKCQKDLRRQVALYDHNGTIGCIFRRWDEAGSNNVREFTSVKNELIFTYADKKGRQIQVDMGSLMRENYRYFWWDRYIAKSSDVVNVTKSEYMDDFNNFINILELKISSYYGNKSDSNSDRSSDSDSDEKSEKNTKTTIVRLVNTHESLRIVESTYEDNRDRQLSYENESENNDLYVFSYENEKDNSSIKRGRLPEIILNGIITRDNISNIKDNKTIINKILKKKKHITIEYIDQSRFAKILDYKDVNEQLSVILWNGQRRDRDIHSFLPLLLGSNVIINSRYLAVATRRGNKGWTIHENKNLWEERRASPTGELETINGKNYCNHTLFIHVPYCIEYNTNKEYYFLNGNYRTVGNDDEKYPKIKSLQREYLYKDTDDLFNNIESYSNKVKKFLLDNNLTKRLDKGFALYVF